MSFGKMNTQIDILDAISIKDDEGFSLKVERVIASIFAFKDEKHGSRKWANMSAYSKANATFQIRIVPKLQIEPGMLIRSGPSTYRIVSVESIKAFYIELAAEKIEAIKV